MIFKSLLRIAGKAIKKLAKKIAKIFAKFMEDLTGWLLNVVKKVEERLGLEVEGTKIFLKHAHAMFKEISKHYSVDERGQWHETTTTREISENEVPFEIRQKVAQKRNEDITNEVKEKLELAV